MGSEKNESKDEGSGPTILFIMIAVAALAYFLIGVTKHRENEDFRRNYSPTTGNEVVAEP